MKRPSYTLTIDNPCHENWNKMTPNEQGRFCAKCSKSLVDFTYMSDNEIIKIISKQSERLCGRLAQEQMNRPLLQTRIQRSFGAVYKMIAGFLFLGASTDALSQTTDSTHVATEVKNDRAETDTIPKTKESKNTIKGTVINSTTREPIELATVRIEDTKTGDFFDGIYSDSEGKFSLKFPTFPKDIDSVKMTVTNLSSFDTVILHVKREDLHSPIRIEMREIKPVNNSPVSLDKIKKLPTRNSEHIPTGIGYVKTDRAETVAISETKNKNIIRGTVIDSKTKEVLDYATVRAYDFETKKFLVGNYSDIEGNFELEIPDSIDVPKTILLQTTYISYDTFSILIERKDLKKPINIEMKKDSNNFILGLIIPEKIEPKKKWWQRRKK